MMTPIKQQAPKAQELRSKTSHLRSGGSDASNDLSEVERGRFGVAGGKKKGKRGVFFWLGGVWGVRGVFFFLKRFSHFCN